MTNSGAVREVSGAPRLGARSPSAGYRADVQGLRAVAVLAVVLYHGGLGVVRGGYVGVDIFFVISGFLISGQLLRELGDNGRIDFGRFFTRRALRLLPAAFVVLALTAVAVGLLYSPLLATEAFKDGIATALYVPNYLFAGAGTDYLTANATPSPFQHYWSLGVEEQFYVFWPLVLVALWALGRRSPRWMAIGVGAFGSISLAACVILTATHQPWAFFSLPTRAWEFALGGLVAGMARHAVRIPARYAAAVSWLGLAALAVAIFGFGPSTVFPGISAALPALGTALVIWAGTQPVSGAARGLLALRPLVFIGTISYSLYLVHWPLLIVPQTAAGFGREFPLWLSLTTMAAAVPLAYLLYRFVESPWRRGLPMRLGGRRPRRAVWLGAVAASALLVVGCLGGGYTSSHRVLGSGTAAATTLGGAPVGTSTVPLNLSPDLRNASEGSEPGGAEGCMLDNGHVIAQPSHCVLSQAPAAPLVVLLGDSHAYQWVPALQGLVARGEIRLDIEAKGGCPVAEVPVTYLGVPYPDCVAWRAAVLARIRAAHPALVLASNFQGYTLPADSGQGVASGIPVTAFAAGMERTLRELARTAPTELIADTPLPREDVPTCLSVHLHDASACDPILDGAYRRAERAAAARAGAGYLDLDGFLCDRGRCPSIIGDTLGYRDNSHLSARMVELLSAPVSRAVESLVRTGSS